ncbi:MAG TPA: twin-arginine translocase subunit TatC [Sphingomonas sp.]|uniref:twin-arginine translocase subunit TatC n=1 Tax=Sphingomonas sp. TaxID=28214 RepID=UPI002B79C276|nr:twin-arginine translocase subunit TatC [Sphingomonas sp.]HMI17924.1 twin-arginine translocase subunit TatC [Sphingomonas sp.]
MTEETDEIDDSRAPLMEHLIELRKRLIWSFAALGLCFAVSLYFARPILSFLVHPLKAAGQSKIVYTEVFGGFITEVKVAFFAGLMLSFPIIANQLWQFIAPGLYRKEKKALLPFLIATPVLFLMGASLARFIAIPLALKYLYGFSGDLGGIKQEALPELSNYLSFTMQFLFGFGAAFLLPVLLMLLERAGIVTRTQLIKFRRYAIVVNFGIAMVLSPPDAGSMLLMAVPLVLLYELAIVGIWFTERKRKRMAEATADDGSQIIKKGDAPS